MRVDSVAGSALAPSADTTAFKAVAGSGADDINGAGGLWASSAYGTGGLPEYIPVPGADVAYGGLFSGPPRSNLSSGPSNYHPLAGEQSAGAPQYNANAERQAFASSLSRLGIQTGGFRPGQFGPPPTVNQESNSGVPSDLGLHQAGGKYPRGPSGSLGKQSEITPAAASNVAAPSSGLALNWSAADLRVLGNFARSNFREYNTFDRDWFGRYPRAWNTRSNTRDLWATTDWAEINAWFGGDWPLYEYTYGNELTYENNDFWLDGRPIATAAKYYASAKAIAQIGERADIPRESATKNRANQAAANWLPLGVFEAIPGGAASNKMLFQLAVNKAGIIRGNYFDPSAKNMQLIQGAVDKQTERTAWVVADKKQIVFDCVLYNLTKSETPVLVHLGEGKVEQWVFVRLVQPTAEVPNP